MLLDLLVLGLGRVGCVARGVRGPRAAGKRALLQPLQPLHVRLAGQGELAHLQAFEAAGAAIRLLGDALLAVLYLNELSLRLLPKGEAVDHYFLSYAQALGALEQGRSLAGTLRRVEYALLNDSGLLPSVEVDVQGRRLAPEQWYRFDPERGVEQLAQPPSGSNSSAIRGAALLSLYQEAELGADDARNLRRLMRQMIERQLGGQALKSWRLLAELQTLRSAPG